MSAEVEVREKGGLQAGRALPAGWRRVRLGDHVTKIGSGLTPLGGQSSYPKTGTPLIRSQNVHMNRFVPAGLAFISEEQDNSMPESRVQPGDVLLNITGASIGRVCIVPAEICPANVNQHVSIIRSDGSFVPIFLSYYLSTPGFQKHIFDAQAGATRQALTKGQIENFWVPLPLLPEQQRIAAILTEQMAAVERACQAADERMQAVRSLPQSLLRQVFLQPALELPACWLAAGAIERGSSRNKEWALQTRSLLWIWDTDIENVQYRPTRWDMGPIESRSD